MAISVYYICDKGSFDSMKSWVEELKSKGLEDILMVIVGNKTDLIDNENVSIDMAEDYVSQQGAI